MIEPISYNDILIDLAEAIPEESAQKYVRMILDELEEENEKGGE